MTTKDMEHAIYKCLTKMGTYLCFEVMMPNEYMGGRPNERVDLLTYNTKGEWRFYELKLTKQDFYSKCTHTFLGNLNYYVMPYSLYEQVKKDIPSHVGCYTVRYLEHCGLYSCECIKKAKRQPLGVDEDKLKFSFMQSLSREYSKYRRLLLKKRNIKKPKKESFIL